MLKDAKHLAGMMAITAILSLASIPLAQAHGGGWGGSGGGWHGGGYGGGWHGGYGGGWHGGYGGGWHGGWGFYWGGPAFGWGWPYYPPPAYYYPPPSYYYPPPAYDYPQPTPGDGYDQTTPARSNGGAAQLCVATPYTCPMEVTISPGSICYCRGNQGQKVYGTAH